MRAFPAGPGQGPYRPSSGLSTYCHNTPGIPIALRVLYGRRFRRGPFHLGPLSYPVAIVSCLWILFIAVAFVLPQENPVNSQTLNYAVVAVGIVAAYALGFWLVSARRWFTGPVKQVTDPSESQSRRA